MTSGDRVNPWVSGDVPRGDRYDLRFARLARQGVDVHGEANFIESLNVRSVLDAGCGTGRVAIELASRGCSVVGVDVDPAMLGEARRKAPEMDWIEADLGSIELERRFESVLLAGNVMIFLVPGSEMQVLANLARHLLDGGCLVSGFSLQAGKLDLSTADRLARAVGLELEDRWSTWDREPFHVSSGYAVSLYRKPAPVNAPGSV